ncbi:MAG: hypothetical protein ACM3II_17860, partial [Rhodospirillaceae bacterium]
MGWSSLVSMELDDEDKLDLSQRSFDGDYPPGLRFTVYGCCFDALAIDLDECEQGSTTQFRAMATVQSINVSETDCRVEMQMEMLSLGSGPFADLERKPFICLHQSDIDKLGLAADCERGDLLDMTGVVRVVEIDKPNPDIGGQDSVVLQIEQMAVENE